MFADKDFARLERLSSHTLEALSREARYQLQECAYTRELLTQMGEPKLRAYLRAQISACEDILSNR